MNVLFISCRSHDVMSLFLYDGFCDLLGEANVICAERYPFLSNYDGGGGRIIRHRKCLPVTLDAVSGLFNLIVLNACFNRDHDWDWAAQTIDKHLAPRGVVAYVEGWDSATSEVFPAPPGIPITRVFRREIEPGYSYPYNAVPLQWATPAWWFDEPRPKRKDYDVTCLCSVAAHPVRFRAMSKIFQANTRHHALVGTIDFEQYLDLTHRSRFVIVPPGGGSDCIRQWEAIGAGCVPIFVGHPPRVRDPWFSSDEILECSVDELPHVIDWALSNNDFPDTQRRLEERARREHTTRARAQRIVELTGVVE